jgi:uroporphyrinogen-III synthase
MKVILTREAGMNEELRKWMPKRVTVVEVPLTTTSYRDEQSFNDELKDLESCCNYVALVVTSARSAKYVSSAVAKCINDVKIFSVGSSTSRAISKSGNEVHTEASAMSLELANHITAGPVLIIGAKEMRHELSDELSKRNITADRVWCYETVGAALDQEQQDELASADVVIIGAPSAWKVARDLVREDAWVIASGEITASEIRDDHNRVKIGWGKSLTPMLEILR